VVFEPQDFLARLVAAIPPPRAHLLRFHGVLAPNAKLRRTATNQDLPELSVRICDMQEITEES
jgi:hypothetical protein